MPWRGGNIRGFWAWLTASHGAQLGPCLSRVQLPVAQRLELLHEVPRRRTTIAPIFTTLLGSGYPLLVEDHLDETGPCIRDMRRMSLPDNRSSSWLVWLGAVGGAVAAIFGIGLSGQFEQPAAFELSDPLSTLAEEGLGQAQKPALAAAAPVAKGAAAKTQPPKGLSAAELEAEPPPSEPSSATKNAAAIDPAPNDGDSEPEEQSAGAAGEGDDDTPVAAASDEDAAEDEGDDESDSYDDAEDDEEEAPSDPATKAKRAASTQTGAAKATPVPLGGPLPSFSIQVASMREAIPAMRSMQRFRKQGHAARVELIGYKKSGLWYVVRIGPFQTRDAAKRYQARLKPSEKKNAQIFPKSKR